MDLSDFDKLNINWFPGHMLKARKQVAAQIRRVDVVLELRDARLPRTSLNRDLNTMLQNKPSVVLFNKAGLADDESVRAWQQHLKEQMREPFLFIDVKQKRNLQRILPLARELVKAKWEGYRKRGIRPPALRLMIVGVPNVGKSSLINAMVKRSAARTGPTPGVTRHQEWILLGNNAELLDTPGILFPKIDTTAAGMNLTLIGAIKDDVVGVEHLSRYLMLLGQKHFSQALTAQYKLEDAESLSPESLLAAIATRRGLLRTGGLIDWRRVGELVLRDFREGKFGAIMLDSPPLSLSKASRRSASTPAAETNLSSALLEDAVSPSNQETAHKPDSPSNTPELSATAGNQAPPPK
jgi:ribosome biogenesis GTPase A